MVELKACPFCGSANISILERYTMCGTVYYVACGGCFNRTKESEDKDKVIDAWERRIDYCSRAATDKPSRMKIPWEAD